MDANQTADRILHRAETLYRSLHSGDDAALRTARDLRSTLDGLINRLTLGQFAPMECKSLLQTLPAHDAELSGVLHG